MNGLGLQGIPGEVRGVYKGLDGESGMTAPVRNREEVRGPRFPRAPPVLCFGVQIHLERTGEPATQGFLQRRVTRSDVYFSKIPSHGRRGAGAGRGKTGGI